MNKWILGIIVPILLSAFLDFLKVVNPIYFALLISAGILLPLGLIYFIVKQNKKSKESLYK